MTTLKRDCGMCSGSGVVLIAPTWDLGTAELIETLDDGTRVVACGPCKGTGQVVYEQDERYVPELPSHLDQLDQTWARQQFEREVGERR